MQRQHGKREISSNTPRVKAEKAEKAFALNSRTDSAAKSVLVFPA